MVSVMVRLLTSTALLVAGVAAVGLSAQAAAGDAGFVTMVSEPGDYIGAGSNRIWRTGAGRITLSGSSATSIAVNVSGGPSGDSFTLTFAAPPGEQLVAGTYAGAQRTPFRTAGRPGIDVYGSGRGCNETAGSFTVLDITPDLSRLHLVYEQHCEGGDPALFGEIAVNEPVDDRELLIAPTHISWPARYPGVPGRPVPVTVVNTGADLVSLNNAAITDGASQFSVVSNGCGTLAPGAVCTLYVNAQPTVTGSIQGTLTLTDSTTAGSHTVSLAGSGISGYTAWTMHSDAGDWIGQGQDYSYTPTTATFSGAGTESRVRFQVSSATSGFTAEFAADAGRLLLPGTTFTGAVRGGSSTAPGIDISGGSRGCNTISGAFTVLDATYTGGIMESFSVEFEQHCEGATPALTGRIDYRSAVVPGDPAPAAVTALRAVAGADSVVLTWSDPTDDDFAHSEVRRTDGAIPPAMVTDGASAYSGTDGTTTVTDLDPSRDYSFTVFPSDTAENVGQGRSVIVRATTVSVTASEGTITAGGKTKVAGAVATTSAGIGLTNRPVELVGRPAGEAAWSTVASANTGAGGSFSFAVAPAVNTVYAVRFPGAGALFPSASRSVEVGVRPSVTLTPSRTSLRVGSRLRLWAEVAPDHAGRLVVLQVRDDGAWADLIAKPLDAAGLATFSVFPAAGRWKYRARVAAHADHLAGTSTPVSVGVR